MELDTDRFTVLHEDDCRKLLRAAPVGRLAFTDQALPTIQPVNFVLDGDDIVIACAPGSKLAAAARGAVVGFEADDFETNGRLLWSVTVVGRAQAVHEPAERARLSGLPLVTWAPGPREHFIRIRGYHISGYQGHH